MAEDARFEDAGDGPLRLRAETDGDVAVISALLQDAVATVGDMAWMPGRRRFALVLNRFRWEDRDAADRTGRKYERVRSVLQIDDVTSVRAAGVDPKAKATVVSLLALRFEPGEDADGVLRLTLAGDGEIAVTVDCIDVKLADATRPYEAPTGKAPTHGDD